MLLSAMMLAKGYHGNEGEDRCFCFRTPHFSTDWGEASTFRMDGLLKNSINNGCTGEAALRCWDWISVAPLVRLSPSNCSRALLAGLDALAYISDRSGKVKDYRVQGSVLLLHRNCFQYYDLISAP